MLDERLQESNKAKLEKSKCKSRINEIENTMAQLYEDKMSRAISQQMFLLMSKKYNDELEILLQSIVDYDKIINKKDIDKAFVKKWINALLNIKHSKSPTYKELSSIIDKIYVNAVGTPERVKIRFKVGFIDEVEEADLQRIA